MADQATLVIIKPDAIQKQLIGAALSKLESLQLEIIGAKVMPVSQALAEEHYKHIQDRPFFRDTVEHLRGLRHHVPCVLVFVLWGPDAIERVRQVVGATNPEKADPQSIRGAFGRNTAEGLMENVLHSSSDSKEAEREIRLWFNSKELLRPALRDEAAPVRARSSR